MYTRLPFDRPATIRELGTTLFTRIQDEEEQAAIRAFLNAPAAEMTALPACCRRDEAAKPSAAEPAGQAAP